MATLPFYGRFIRVPAILSFWIALGWLLSFFCATFYGLTGYWGGVATIPVLALGTCSAMILRSMLKTKMMRSRMWKWGRDKFDSWQEFSEWVGLTPYYKLNQVAEMKDDEWLPAKGGGLMNTKVLPPV